MARGAAGHSGISTRVIVGMVAFVIFFAVLQVLEGLSGWNGTAVYATIVKTTVPIFIGLYVLIGAKLDQALTR